MNQAIFNVLNYTLISTIVLFLFVVVMIYLFRHKVRAFDLFLNSLQSMSKQEMTCSDSELLKEILPKLKNLSLQDRLILIQALTQRDITIQIGMNDIHFWIEGLHGIDMTGKE